MIARIALVTMSAVMCACSASAPITPDAGATPSEAGTKKVSVRGDVVDPEGAPWASAKIQVCSVALCTIGDADASGAFSVLVPPNDHYHVIAHAGPNDTREGSSGLFVLADELTADITLDAPVAIPITGAHAALGAPAHVTPDLTLTANAADIAFSGEAYFSGVSIAETAWPAFTIAGKTILAMWALNPWGARANTDKTIAVSITNHFGLAAHDVASVYAVNETTAALDAPTQGVVSADGATIDGATVDRVTWIVLAH